MLDTRIFFVFSTLLFVFKVLETSVWVFVSVSVFVLHCTCLSVIILLFRSGPHIVGGLQLPRYVDFLNTTNLLHTTVFL